MPFIGNPPPYEETMEFLRNAKPPGEYSRKATAERQAARAAAPSPPKPKKAAEVSVLPPVLPEHPLKHVYGFKIGRGLGRFNGKTCAYCLQPMHKSVGRKPTRDHVYPRAMGGTLHVENVLIACVICNEEKRDMTLQSWLSILESRDDARAPIVRELAVHFPPLTPGQVKALARIWEKNRQLAEIEHWAQPQGQPAA